MFLFFEVNDNLFALKMMVENTKGKYDFYIRNLTNTNLLTIGRHYTLTGSSAFLHFEASDTQDIGTANTEMHHESKKALVYQGLSANF